MSNAKTYTAITAFERYSHPINAIVQVKSNSKGAGKPLLTPPTQTIQKLFGSSDKIVAWGKNNKLPNEWEATIEANDTLRGAVELATNQLFSGGIEYGIMELGKDDKKTFKPLDNPEIDAFINSPITQLCLEQSAKDLIIHGFHSPEFLFDNGKVYAIYAHPTANLRWFEQDNNGNILNAVLSRNWILGVKSDDKTAKTLPVIDPLIHTPDMVSSAGYPSAIFRVPIATSHAYYPVSALYASFLAGWVNVDNKVALFYNSILSNQMTPKFLITILMEWLEEKYGSRYTDGSPEEKTNVMREELTHINEMMHGERNAGKNIMIPKIYCKLAQELVPAWEMQEFNGSISDSHLGLAQFAKDRILASANIDPTVMGFGKSSGMGGGSGSDKREAFNISHSTQIRTVNKWLMPLNYAAQINGWVENGKPIVFRTIQPMLQTLNQVTPSDRQNTQKP